MKLVAPKPKMTRPSSCSVLPSRRVSSVSIATVPQTTDLFQGVYKGSKITSQPPMLITYRGVPMQIPQIIKLKAKSDHKSTKTVQELIQQNLQLKNQINRLKQTLSRVKGQLMAKKSPANGLGIIDVQVQYNREAYWSTKPSLYRVEGVKQQYEKLKKKCEQQQLELKQLKSKFYNTSVPQLQIYIGHLEQEIQRLNNTLLFKQQKQQVCQSKYFSNSSQKHKIHSIPQFDQQTIRNASRMFSTTQRQVPEKKEFQEKLKQKNNQIQFLEKSVIKKGNLQHHASCKLRKLRKQHQKLLEEYRGVQDRVEDDQKKLQIMRVKIMAYYQHEIQKLKKQNYKILHEKEKQIKQLQKSLKEAQNSNAMNNNKSRISNQQSLLTQNRRPRKSSHDFLFLSHKIQEQQEVDLTVSRRQQTHNLVNQNSGTFNVDDSGGSSILSKSKKEIREPKRSNCKYNQQSIKARKVQYADVKQIAELLRFRMLANGVQEGHIRDYFVRRVVFSDDSVRSKSKDSQNFFEIMQKVVRQEQKQWQDEYITMKQCQQILQSHPFNLPQSTSHLLSRYLVEDNEDQFQYINDENQTKRQIVKSIIKSLIGSYELPTEQEMIKYEYMIQKYGNNIKNTLKSVAPNGIIDRKKLIQVVVGVGAEPSQKMRDILIGKACVKSQGLAELDYLVLFENRVKKNQ